MSEFVKIVSANGTTRYRDGGTFVATAVVPEQVIKVLDTVPAGTKVDELGDVIDPETETDEGSGDDTTIVAQTAPVVDEATTEDTKATETETDEEDVPADTNTEDVNDTDTSAEDGDGEQNDTPTPPVPAPTREAKEAVEMGAMGFPAKNGKTLSIFGEVPHETVKNVGGILVPLTLVELNGDRANGIEPRNDAEIIERLKELGKV